jgi:signal transduction histidine kinase
MAMASSRYGDPVDSHVFISYRHGPDAAYVEHLEGFLLDAGIPVWHDREVVTGDRWESVIKAKIEACSALIVVMTPDADASDWVKREITLAEHLGRPILPLLLQGNGFFRLSNVQFEDVRGGQLPSVRFLTRLRQLSDPAAVATDLSDDRRAMVVSLARRNQIVQYRLVRLLTQLEEAEQDSPRRARLAEAKALASRLRRNDESLLIVVDDESTRRTASGTARLHDVLADQVAARPDRTIEFPRSDRNIEVAERVVHDLGLVFTELLDNAITFSPPESVIRVHASRQGRGACVRIEDDGIGITEDHLARLKATLAGPPVLDAEVVRKMGLAVVARLADRHGMAVELRSAPEQGTTVQVDIPESALAAARSRSPGFLEIPARVVRAGLAAIPREQSDAILADLPEDQVRVILSGRAGEQAEAALDRTRAAGWPLTNDVPAVARPGLRKSGTTSDT